MLGVEGRGVGTCLQEAAGWGTRNMADKWCQSRERPSFHNRIKNCVCRGNQISASDKAEGTARGLRVTRCRRLPCCAVLCCAVLCCAAQRAVQRRASTAVHSLQNVQL